METSNHFRVTRTAGAAFPIRIGELRDSRRGVATVTDEEALNLAAWIVALVDPKQEKLPALLKEILS